MPLKNFQVQQPETVQFVKKRQPLRNFVVQKREPLAGFVVQQSRGRGGRGFPVRGQNQRQRGAQRQQQQSFQLTESPGQGPYTISNRPVTGTPQAALRGANRGVRG